MTSPKSLVIPQIVGSLFFLFLPLSSSGKGIERERRTQRDVSSQFLNPREIWVSICLLSWDSPVSLHQLLASRFLFCSLLLIPLKFTLRNIKPILFFSKNISYSPAVASVSILSRLLTTLRPYNNGSRMPRERSRSTHSTVLIVSSALCLSGR